MNKIMILCMMNFMLSLAGCGNQTTSFVGQPKEVAIVLQTGPINPIPQNYLQLSGNVSSTLLASDVINIIPTLVDSKYNISSGVGSEEKGPTISPECAHVVLNLMYGKVKEKSYCLGTLYGKYLPAELNPVVPYFVFKEQNTGVNMLDDSITITKLFSLLQQNNATGVNELIQNLSTQNHSLGTTSMIDLEKNIVYAIPYRAGMIIVSYFSYGREYSKNDIQINIALDYMIYDGRQYQFVNATGESHTLSNNYKVDNYETLYQPLPLGLSTICETGKYNDTNCTNAIIVDIQNPNSSLQKYITDFKKSIDKVMK